MEVIIQANADRAARLAARVMADQIRENWRIVLGLATGRTMERVYDLLSEMHHSEDLDFSGCVSFNLDEYIGLAPDDSRSYRYYMNEHLFDKVNIDIRRTHLPDGLARDLKLECKAYEDRIRSYGGIDLQLLGIGEDGHIGFNEPLSSLRSRTRDKALTPDTRRQNCQMFGGDPDKVPGRALTMGVGTILEARRILLVVTGSKKAEVLAKATEGPITSMISASALQLHPACTVICDESAAASLQGRDYYHWIFENEPEWEKYRSL